MTSPQRIRALNAKRRALQGRIGSRFAKALHKEFKRQGDLVAARYLASQKRLDTGLMTQAEYDAILDLFMGHEGEMWVGTSSLAGELVGVEAVPMNPRTVSRIARRVKQVDEVTRTAIRRAIADAHTLGMGQDAVAENLRGVVSETYANRHKTIARTELAVIDQEAAHDRYRAVGLTHVLIEDGADCGWLRHDDPDKADGTIRTIADADAHPTSHPNCVRSSGPHIPEDF